MLREVITAYGTRSSPAEVEVLTIEEHTWGGGLNELSRRAQGAYWFCAADDAVPQGGWFQAGLEALEAGVIPAARFHNQNGTPTHAQIDAAPHGHPVGWTRLFLLTPEIYAQVGAFLDASWYLDFDYSERLIAAGYPIDATDGFSFVHLDGDRDWLDEETDRRDHEIWQASVRARQAATA